LRADVVECQHVESIVGIVSFSRLFVFLLEVSVVVVIVVIMVMLLLLLLLL